MKGIFFVLSVSFAIVLGSGIASAQYPQPTGNLTLTASATVAGTGASIPLECILRDVAGAPIPNTPCTFSIDGEPAGSDSAVGSKVITKMTDANGVATTILRTGSVPGQLVVSATSGTFKSVVVVTVSGSTAGGTPPASPISPPATGDGGLAH